MPLIPVHSKLKQEYCVVETTSLNYTGKSCLRNLKKEKHTGQGVGAKGERDGKQGEYIKLTNLMLCSYLYTASPTGMHLSRNASFTYSLLADITALI